MNPDDQDRAAASLLRTESWQAAVVALADSVERGHPAVLVLGDLGSVALVEAACNLLVSRGRIVVPVAAGQFTPTDLVRAGHDGIVAIAGADALSRRDLRAIEAHLRARETPGAVRAQLLFAGTEAFRETTSFPDYATLHATSLVHDLPPLDAAEAGAHLARFAPHLGAKRGRLVAEAAGGDAALLSQLAVPGFAGRRRTLGLGWLGRPVDHPVGLASVASVLLAASAAFAVIRVPRAPPPQAPVIVLPTESAPTPAPIPDSPQQSASVPEELQGGGPDTGAAPAAGRLPYAVDQSDPPDGDATEGSDAVRVDHESAAADAAAAAAHLPLLVEARKGETLRAMYDRVYRGLQGPSFARVEQINPAPPSAGARIVFPAPHGGWPRS